MTTKKTTPPRKLDIAHTARSLTHAVREHNEFRAATALTRRVLKELRREVLEQAAQAIQTECAFAAMRIREMR